MVPPRHDPTNGPLILFYNSFFGDDPDVAALDCDVACRFTSDRRRLREADAVVFHLPKPIEIGDAAKHPGQIWVGWSMESTAHTPILADRRVMRHFDLMMTFRRSADVWCPYLPGWDEWRAALDRPPPARAGRRLAALFQSAAKNTSRRNEYSAALMRHMPVHSYGRFRNNAAMPVPDLGFGSKIEVLRNHTFCLSFENDLEPDYVTEKFFHPLLAGVIPVYRGAPNVRDYAPGDDCFIDANAFDGPERLAAYLRDLAADAAACDRYLQWRSRPLRPGFVELMQRTTVPLFCRLARAVTAALDARRGAAAGTRAPFGWLAQARTRAWRLRKRLSSGTGAG